MNGGVAIKVRLMASGWSSTPLASGKGILTKLKESRIMIEDYLKKLQELQRDTLNTGINIYIATRYDYENKYPWLSVTVTLEGWTSDAFKSIPYDMKYLAAQMYGRMHEDEKDREAHQAAVYARIEKFVKDKLEALNK